jgi:hypothetical protein
MSEPLPVKQLSSEAKLMSCRALVFCVSAALVPACLGCGAADRAEIAKLKQELAEARAEVKALKSLQSKPEQKPSSLDELERLDRLREKGTLTREEFEAKKKELLGESQKPSKPASTVEQMGKQIRAVYALYRKDTITTAERDRKKQQVLAGPLSLTDLTKDLEAVMAFYREDLLTTAERDALKKRILDLDAAKK